MISYVIPELFYFVLFYDWGKHRRKEERVKVALSKQIEKKGQGAGYGSWGLKETVKRS